MIVVVFAIALIIFITLFKFFLNQDSAWSVLFIILAFVCFIVLVGFGTTIIENQCYKQAIRDNLNEKIEAIYQAAEYNKEDDPIQVVQMIRDYNISIKQHQTVLNNIWIGILYSDVYDEYRLIDYEEVLNNERSE